MTSTNNSQARFRLVCPPSAVTGAPSGWAREMLREGEVALIATEGLDSINAVAHDLDQVSISVLRTEESPAKQDHTVIAFAGGLPLIWIAPTFSDEARSWAHERGPMTLLVTGEGPLADEELRRIDRFVAILGRQSE